MTSDKVYDPVLKRKQDVNTYYYIVQEPQRPLSAFAKIIDLVKKVSGMT